MNKKVLIVEDQFVEANDLQLMLRKAGYEVCGIARSVDIAEEMIKKEKPGLVLLDIFLKGKRTGIDLARQIKADNIAFIYLSANSNEEVLHAAKATEPYGFLVKPFREKDLLIMLEIAWYRHQHSVESNMKMEKILNDKLSAVINKEENLEGKLLSICRSLQSYVTFDYVTAGFNTITDTASQALSFLRIGYDEYQKIGVSELLTISGLKIGKLVDLVKDTLTSKGATNAATSEELSLQPSLDELFYDMFQMKSCVSLSLQLKNGGDFILSFYSKNSATYNMEHVGSLHRLKKVLTNAIESIPGGWAKKNADLSKFSDSTKPIENSFQTGGFDGIVGRSHLLLKVFDLISRVAPTDTSVLILGESGTGKERIADCIHNLSPRKNKPFVKINCSALPTTLIESELFGHERGSFTGAHERHIGKFEQADEGTIFLDEIGEMPPDLQVKLLRVLQEKYIERIGARSITKVNLRIIAATNRKLEKEVSEGRFRLDLYYRLNVFPIELPPLRERKDDIPAIADHFVNHFNRKAGKKVAGLTDRALKSLMEYSWPGNIRELENLIERSVLLANGKVIEEISLPTTQTLERPGSPVDFRLKTIHENERDHIIAVLKKCNGKIWGIGGAAEILDVPPSTLRSKMKKLNIRKEEY